MIENTTAPREGFDAASPYELCQRYAAGYITRDSLVDQLTRWHYTPEPEIDPWNEVEPSVPGSFQEVLYAKHEGLIDRSIYDEVLMATTEPIA
ncbi:hypothetical protein [Kytococcus sp. Marseille-QA3725]